MALTIPHFGEVAIPTPPQPLSLLASGRVVATGIAAIDDQLGRLPAVNLDLSPCVKQILCGLSQATLQALKAFLNAQVVVVRAAITTTVTKLLAFDVLNAPFIVARAAVQTAIDAVEGAAGLVPLSVITDCLPLGKYAIELRAGIDAIEADALIVLDELTRHLSFGQELVALAVTLNQKLDLYQGIIEQIDGCGSFTTLTVLGIPSAI